MLDEGGEGLESEKIHWGVDGEDGGGVGSDKLKLFSSSSSILS